MQICNSERVIATDDTAELRRSNAKKEFVFPFLMLLLYLAQCIWFVRTQSMIVDEPLHMIAGLEAWRYGRFELILDHPPLGHLLPTVPLARGNWDILLRDPAQGRRGVWAIPDPVAMATRARLVNVSLGLVLGVLLWLTTRKLFSANAANVAIALFAFSPSLITHFSIVTTDGIATLMIFATAAQLLSWRTNSSRGQTVVLGIILGLLLLAKLSTPPVFCLTLLLMLVLKPDGWIWSPRGWNWFSAILAACIAVLVLWAGYFFHVSRLKTGDGTVVMTSPNRDPVVKTTVGSVVGFLRVPLRWHLNLVVPAGEYLEGISYIYLRNKGGHGTYQLGRISDHPSLMFFPTVALLKWPPVVWLLFVGSLLLFFTRRIKPPPGLFLLSLFPACFLVPVMLSRIAMGERHFLPVYPFVLLIASAAWEWADHRGTVSGSGERSRAFALLIVALLAVNSADALRYAPGYLSYANILVPKRESYKFLSDSNIDWGQGLLALRRYETEHPNEKISLAYFGEMNPADYGIKAIPLREDQRASGTVVISATYLSGLYLENRRAYEWVTKFPLVTILDHCLFVFSVPAATSQQPATISPGSATMGYPTLDYP